MIHFRIFSGFSLVSKLGLRFSLEFCSKFIPALFANDMLLGLNHLSSIFKLTLIEENCCPFSTPPNSSNSSVNQCIKLTLALDRSQKIGASAAALNIWLRNHSRKFTHLMAHRSATKCDWQLPSLIKRSSIKEKRSSLSDFQPIQFQEFVPQNKLKCSVVKTR